MTKIKTAYSHIRFYALIGDFSISYIFYSYCQSFKFFRGQMLILENFLNKFEFVWSANFIDNGNEYIYSLIKLYFIYIGIRFISSLIFGVTFSQFLLGLRGSGNLFWNRIGGASRITLELFTSPMLIFDLPALFGKRTLKEVLTFTKVVKIKNGLLCSFSKFIGIPIIILGSIFSPMLENFALLDGINVSFTNSAVEKLSNDSDFSKFKSYNSNKLHLSAFSSLNQGNLLIIPSFDIYKSKGIKKLIPFILVYDKVSRTSAEFRVIERFKLLNILKLGIKGNPLFIKKYKTLGHVVNSNYRDNYKRISFDSSKDYKKLFNDNLSSDIEYYIKASFELSLSKIHWHILENGPFVRGHVLVRNKLLEKAESGPMPKVDIVKIGGDRFLTFFHIDDQRKIRNNYIEKFFSLNTNSTVLFQLSTDEEGMNSKINNIFKRTFLSSAKWYFDYKNVFEFSDKLTDLGPLSIFDFFINKKIKKKDRFMLENYIYDYFFTISKNSLIDDDEKLQEHILKILDRFLVASKFKDKNNKMFYRQSFINFIKSLKVYLKRKDHKFFNI